MQLQVDDYLTQIRELRLQIAKRDDEKDLLQKRLRETLQRLAETEDQKRVLEEQLEETKKLQLDTKQSTDNKVRNLVFSDLLVVFVAN